MSWKPLRERIASLPLILTGPILRRTEPHTVTVWLALKAPQMVTLHIYRRKSADELEQCFTGTRHTIRLGDYLHIVAVTAQAETDEEQLSWGELYYYDLSFQAKENFSQHLLRLSSPGVLTVEADPASELERLVYPGHPLPSFVLPPEDLNLLKIMHGSCRKPHGYGKEMLSALDVILEKESQPGGHRPQQLYFTGDQIYSDDVASPLLFALIDAGTCLFTGNREELLPMLGMPARALAPGNRTQAIRNKALFTTGEGENHLMSLAEYIAMYLFTWSDVLWPPDLPEIETIWSSYPEIRPEAASQREVEKQHYLEPVGRLRQYQATLPRVRRVLANISTYMMCDDHDVTDDWYLDGAWCQRVLGSPLGKRLIRNALLAFALCQAWGNTPQRFAAGAGAELLEALDQWRGAENPAFSFELECLLNIPSSFDGSGELSCSDQSLLWYFSYTGPRFQILALDTRTQRFYRTPEEFPGLLSPKAMQQQIATVARYDVDLTILVSPTPVLGIEFIEAIQFWSRFRVKDNYGYDREAWALEWNTFQRFLKLVGHLRSVVFLSGDVHYAFGSSLEYWDHNENLTAKMVDFTSSPLRNESSDLQMAILSVGYPYLFHLLGREEMPTADFFAWDVSPQRRVAFQTVLRIIHSRLYQLWWSIPRLIDIRRSQHDIVLPARGWPHGAFHNLPPNRSYRLHYLRNSLYRPPTQKPMLDLVRKGRVTVTGHAVSMVRTLLRWTNFLDRRLERFRGRLARRTLPQQETPRGTRHVLRGAIKGVDLLEESVDKGKGELAEIIYEREKWLNKWKAGSHIVGYANIGEITFNWSPNGQSATQRLWWWHPDVPKEPTIASEYRDILTPPAPQDAPPLP